MHGQFKGVNNQRITSRYQENVVLGIQKYLEEMHTSGSFEIFGREAGK